MTPGAVVFRNEVLEVLQYGPQTETVHRIPVVVVPPQINKFYFMDLSPGRSLTEYALRRGLQFFAISWRNPTKQQRDWDLDTYGRAIIGALDAVQEITGSDQVHLFGLVRRWDHHGHRAEPPGRRRRRPGAQRQLRGHPAGLVGARAGRDDDVGAAAPAGRLALPDRRGDGRPVAGVGVHLDATQRPGLELLGQRLPDGPETGARSTSWPGTRTGPTCPPRCTASSWTCSPATCWPSRAE